MSKHTKLGLIVILLTIIASVGLFTCYMTVVAPLVHQLNTLPPSQMATLKAPQSGYSIDYPITWQAFETPGGNRGDLYLVGVISHFDRNWPIVTISRQDFLTGDLEEVVAWGIARIKEKHEFAAYHPITAGDFATSRFSGFANEYTLVEPTLLGSVTRHCLDWYLLTDDIGYSLSYCVDEDGWSEHESIFRQMIASFSVSSE